MTVFSLMLGVVFVVVLIQSDSIEDGLIGEVLNTIEVQRGKMAALLAACEIVKGAEWWEVL